MATTVTGLSPADIITVNLSFESQTTATRNFGALLVVGDSDVLSDTETVREYAGLTGVTTDFGTASPEYAAAAAFFGQSPSPTSLRVGKIRSGETALSAVTRLRASTADWYGLGIATAVPQTDSENVSVAQFIEGASPSSVFCITTAASTTPSSTSTTDLASTLAAATLNRTFVQYSSTSPYAALSLFGLFATIDYTGVATTITAKFKTEPGITAETLTETEAAALDSKFCNYYVTYQTGATYVQQGWMCSGRWIDSQIGADAFVNAIQVAGINLLASMKKVPQTDPGMTTMKAAYNNICEQFVSNGFLGGGLIWNGPTIGSLNTGDTLSEGYYIYKPKISTQSAADRGARKAVSMTICLNEAGAVHSGIINVNVEQ